MVSTKGQIRVVVLIKGCNVEDSTKAQTKVILAKEINVVHLVRDLITVVEISISEVVSTKG